MKSISQKEFAERRRKLMEHMVADSVAIIPSARMLIRNRDVEHQFRQDSDFYYLTGFDEPDACLVLIPGREQGEVILFCRDRDPEREIWDGYRQGPEGVVKNFGADHGFPIEDIDEILPGLIEGRSRIYTGIGVSPDFDRQLMEWVNQIRAKVRTGARPPEDFSDISHLLHDMRLIKGKAEVEMMRRAAEISARAHTRAMEFVKPGVFGYQLEAEINHEFSMAGSRRPAYQAIVGSGANSCILHYVENTKKIEDGDLILIDAGCEYGYYAADITRTFPANGRFSDQQKAIYQLVLDAQYAAIDAVKPGNTFNDPHIAALRVITEGLVELGLLTGDVDELIESEAYKDFFMHRTGHWLGMDVHDVGDYKLGGEWRVLEPGMVLTIEPGVYVSPDNEQVDPKWRGIGVRIEDDVLVTSSGYDVLTKDVIKEVSDIEALMNGGQAGLF
jgi:Xaa-Pro aminopeptidase